MEKKGVFISHITEEKKTALCLKEYLRESLGWGLQVFVSSDYESISGGDLWFPTIVNALKTSLVEVVLLSPTSVGRPWINFEAGIGIGAEITVIPLIVHGLGRSEVGHPLASLQIRSLEDDPNVRALLRDVGKGIGHDPRVLHMERFLEEINESVDPSAGGWSGAKWEKTYLAVDGPILGLPERSPQTYIDDMGNALRSAGFTPRLSARNRLGPSAKAGYKIVYMTDRKSYRAEIHSGDVMLTAKPGDKEV
jgi:hypothetical protein